MAGQRGPEKGPTPNNHHSSALPVPAAAELWRVPTEAKVRSDDDAQLPQAGPLVVTTTERTSARRGWGAGTPEAA